eukprot:1158728-Pelagomonas_calceolata.AAC.2
MRVRVCQGARHEAAKSALAACCCRSTIMHVYQHARMPDFPGVLASMSLWQQSKGLKMPL